MKLRDRMAREVVLVYQDFRHLPPLALLVLSCMALLLAATIAFGIHL